VISKLKSEGYVGQAEDLRNIRTLYDKVSKVLHKYEDREWEKLNKDLRGQKELAFLFILCWGNYNENGQLSQWSKVKENFLKSHKPLHQLTDKQIERLGYFLSIAKNKRRQWPVNFLKNLVRHLRSRSLTFDEFCDILKAEGAESPQHAIVDLMNACDTSSSKIVECFLRDCLKIDCFPIDLRIRRVLQSYHIPDDSRKLVECCRQLNINPRIFNRAIFMEYVPLIGEK